jgi:hypothetical protein
MAVLAKFLILLGVAIAVLGLLLWVGSSLPWFDRLGHLPGDIYVRRGNFIFYFPLATSILISLIATLVLTWLRRW